jgi:hypothetical protein
VQYCVVKVLATKIITYFMKGKCNVKVHPGPGRPKGAVEVYLYSFFNVGAR